MLNPTLAQTAADTSTIQTWLLILAPLTVGALFSLVGVFLGYMLDRKARREERREAAHASLMKDASDVIGQARVVVTMMSPDGYTFWADKDTWQGIVKRRDEATPVRPLLAALAVRWRPAAPELNAIESYLGRTPALLNLLVGRVLDRDDVHWDKFLDQLNEEHEAVLEALTRAVEKLPKEHIPGA
jgi:membrane protein implicated in regulation of membrane protease activity